MKDWINSSYKKALPADQESKNQVRQVKNASYSVIQPHIQSPSKCLHFNPEMAQKLGFTSTPFPSQEMLHYLSGKALPKGIDAFAMNYGGHQFGQWAGQLGDGRALNIGEVYGWQLQLKGAGKTPYSRHADGRAVLRSSIREYLMAEAMHHLGIPTTRSLALVELEDKIERDMLYNGHPQWEKSAVLTRIAPSFIRFGHFEIHAARKEYNLLRTLADYCIDQYYPEIQEKGRERYIAFFEAVANKTLETILHWQRVGFVHGVMNTDNMSILGLTIDYGPFGFLDAYDPHFTPNTTDFATRRYRYENQPIIAQWNLLQLANALYPLVKESAELETILNAIPQSYNKAYTTMMKSKMGLFIEDSNDAALIHQLEENLQRIPTDYTVFFRVLSQIQMNENMASALEIIRTSWYRSADATTENKWKEWLTLYLNRIKLETLSCEVRKKRMNKVNPKYILRNYMLYECTEQAEKNQYYWIEKWYQLAQQPYSENPTFEKWFALAPEWAKHTIGCSVLSCSS